MDKHALFQTLAIAALVDGELGPDEKVLLQRHASFMKLLPGDVDQILEDVQSGKATGIAKPESAKARMSLFHDVVQIVRADRKLTKNEQKLVKRVGNAFEIPEDEIEKALRGRPVG